MNNLELSFVKIAFDHLLANYYYSFEPKLSLVTLFFTNLYLGNII